MKYLKRFDKNEQYIKADMPIPNVAICEDYKDLHYNTDIKALKLTCDSEVGVKLWTKDTNPEFVKPNVEYSLDEGKTWNVLEGHMHNMHNYEFNTINLQAYQTLYLRGDNPNGFSGLGSYPERNFTWIEATTGAPFICEGSINALVSYTEEVETLPNEFCFFHLFQGIVLFDYPEMPPVPYIPYIRFSYLGLDGESNGVEIGYYNEVPEKVQYSLDEGVTWKNITFSYNGQSYVSPYIEVNSTRDVLFRDLSETGWCFPWFYTQNNDYDSDYTPDRPMAVYGHSNAIHSKEYIEWEKDNDTCYETGYELFEDCKALVIANIEFPDYTYLEDYVFYKMCYGCYGLKYGPEILPGKDAYYNGWYGEDFYETFESCYNLRKAPIMKLERTYYYEMEYMFYDCYNLEKAPDILINDFYLDCELYCTFAYCYKLRYIRFLTPPGVLEWYGSSIDYNDTFYDWLYDAGDEATKTPTFICYEGVYDEFYDNSDYYPYGWKIVEIPYQQPTLKLMAAPKLAAAPVLAVAPKLATTSKLAAAPKSKPADPRREERREEEEKRREERRKEKEERREEIEKKRMEKEEAEK